MTSEASLGLIPRSSAAGSFIEICDLVDILSDERSLEILNEYLKTYTKGSAWGFDAESIYAFEGDKNIFIKLLDNIGRLPEEMSSKIIAINEFITKSTNWESYLENKKITLINADIEGNKLLMLEAMKSIIEKNRPVLAICLYHKKEDMIENPQFINNIVSEYKFYLRKYPSIVKNIRRNHEIVLYAVPKERSIK